MTDLGYIRVSTGQQTLDQQREALLAAGVLPERIYEDTISGVRTKRPGLDALLDYAREGDTVTVVRLDRLGRSLQHIVNTIAELRERGVAVRSLTEGIDMGTAGGKAMAHMFMLMAEYERDLLRERLAEARASVERKGGRWGRPAALTADQALTARRMREAGVDIATIARTLGVSRATVYRYSSPVEASA
jgi:DNA invertase Pin-like site-specific DNA recombinase